MRTKHTPLLELADGADADDRAAVVSAFNRIWRQGKPQITDLHVREFVLSVFAVAKSETGVQWSYGEIADRLACSISTARRVVERASREFGLVAVVEERYMRGGQAANRYRIEWQAVRSANLGNLTRKSKGIRPGAQREQAPAHTEQPGAQREQAPAHTEHPYKESTSIYTSTKTSTHSLTEPASEPDDWRVVVSALEGKGMAAASKAAEAAERRGMTPDQALELVALWERLKARQTSATVSWLYRWLTGQSRPPEDAGAAQSPQRRSTLMDTATEAEKIRTRIWKVGKQQGRTEEEIQRAVQRAIAQKMVQI